MILTKLALGVIFLLLGWIYLYNPNIILYINRFARDMLFNDRSVLLQQKKLAILFFCLSLLALYMGATSLLRRSAATGDEQWTAERNQFLMYSATQDYYSKKYNSALLKYGKILECDPGNTGALEQLGAVYRAAGDVANAKSAWYRLLQLNPGNTRVLDNLRKLEKESLQKKVK